MAIALVTQTGAQAPTVTGEDTSVQTLSIDSGATGSDRMLIVGFWAVQSGWTLNSATYGAQSMTLIGTTFTTESSRKGGMLYLANPATGANTLTLTFAAACGAGFICSAVISGAKQTSQPDSVAGLSGQTGTTASISTTVVADNSWLFMFVRNAGSPNFIYTDGTDTTLTVDSVNDTTSPSTSSVELFRSTTAVAAGSRALSASWGSSGTWGGVTASFAPSTTASTPTFQLVGVGT